MSKYVKTSKELSAILEIEPEVRYEELDKTIGMKQRIESFKVNNALTFEISNMFINPNKINDDYGILKTIVSCDWVEFSFMQHLTKEDVLWFVWLIYSPLSENAEGKELLTSDEAKSFVESRRFAYLKDKDMSNDPNDQWRLAVTINDDDSCSFDWLSFGFEFTCKKATKRVAKVADYIAGVTERRYKEFEAEKKTRVA